MLDTAWHPQREVEIVAGTPPGGGLDRSARALLKAMQAGRRSGVPAKVVNVAGDGGRKAWEYLDRFPGDAHVVSISSPNLTTDYLTGISAFEHSAYTPLAILYTEYIAFVARADSQITGAGELLRRIRADAASLTVALSTSLGNPNHIAVAKVVRHAGADARAPRIRVFDSALDAVADAAAGSADIAAVTAASAVRELDAGTMRALAVSAPQRLGGCYSHTPTWREQSVDCVVGAWRGVSGARGLAPEHVEFWEKTLSEALATPEWKGELARHYWTSAYLDGAALRGALARESAEMRVTLGELGLIKSP
jgi:putative tricarboxylic transport membrane protein